MPDLMYFRDVPKRRPDPKSFSVLIERARFDIQTMRAEHDTRCQVCRTLYTPAHHPVSVTTCQVAEIIRRAFWELDDLMAEPSRWAEARHTVFPPPAETEATP